MAEGTDHDVIIVGGGPGGSTAANFLAREGLDVLLLDKETFPRDKPCGDAVSGKSIGVLRELGLADQIEESPHSRAMGVTFSSPKGDVVTIPFPKKVDPDSLKHEDKEYNYITPGYVCRREVYDDILFQAAKEQENVTTIEGFRVSDVTRDERGAVNGVVGKNGGAETTYTAKAVIGAGGALCPIAQAVGSFERDPYHWIGAFRIYYEGVKDLTENIELHFVDDLIPGYFWIFPLDNGLANVGAGMLEVDLKGIDGHEKVYMREVTYDIIENHPMFKDRFADAKEVPKSFRGWQLPVGSKHRQMVGDGWALVGDSGGLIDPFSGEGIGNAMVSARLLSRVLPDAIRKDDVTAATLQPYEDNLRRELDRELQMSYKLQQLGQRRWLLNWVLRRAAKSENVQHLISDMLADREKKEDFGSLWFYLKLLFT